MPKAVTIALGCEIEEEVYRSRSLGTFTLTRPKTWMETFLVPEEGYNKRKIVCPICASPFEVKVYSKQKARLRKFYFASCFLTIAACGILFGVFAGREEGFIGYSLAAPFILFAAWQFFNALRGRFDASDIVSHLRGKIHRIFDEKRLVFSRQ